jgi:hypothetical protein
MNLNYGVEKDLMNLKIKILISLIVLALVDMVIPIPFTTILLLYVLIEKPLWFRKMVTDVYGI